MKNHALFSSKNKSRKLKCRLLQFLFGALRVLRCRTGTPKCIFAISSNAGSFYDFPLVFLDDKTTPFQKGVYS